MVKVPAGIRTIRIGIGPPPVESLSQVVNSRPKVSNPAIIIVLMGVILADFLEGSKATPLRSLIALQQFFAGCQNFPDKRVAALDFRGFKNDGFKKKSTVLFAA